MPTPGCLVKKETMGGLKYTRTSSNFMACHEERSDEWLGSSVHDFFHESQTRFLRVGHRGTEGSTIGAECYKCDTGTGLVSAKFDELQKCGSEQFFCYYETTVIKTIFFDFDGVLTTDAKGSLTMSKNLCDLTPGLSVQSVLDTYRQDIESLNMGRISMSDVWKRLCTAFQIPANDDLLREMMRRVPKNDAMFDLAQSLSPRYRLGIITDNNRERMDVLVADMQLDKLFDPIVVSATEHASKRDGTTIIFDVALNRANCSAEEALFIDNQEKNLEVPAKMGMKTFWHDDAKNDVSALLATLRDWGVEVPVVFVPLNEDRVQEVEQWPKDSSQQWLDCDPAHLLQLQRSSPGRRCFVALDGNQSVGVVDVEENGDGTAWMSLFVRPDARGMGIGQSILSSLLHDKSVAHIHELKVEIEKDNPASLRCFENAGFVRREEPATTEDFVFLAAKVGIKR